MIDRQKIKVAHGGKRKGAGRPQVKLSRSVTPLKKVTAEEILSEVDETAQWKLLIADTDSRVRLETMKYLTNRRDGMPPQSVNLQDGRNKLDFGNIPTPNEFNQSRTTDKPN